MDEVTRTAQRSPSITETHAGETKLAGPGEKEGDVESPVDPSADSEQNRQQITGLQLFAILASVTLSAFLMLLDGSIIGVVSRHVQVDCSSQTDRGLRLRQFPTSQANSTPLMISVGIPQHTNWPGKTSLQFTHPDTATHIIQCCTTTSVGQDI